VGRVLAGNPGRGDSDDERAIAEAVERDVEMLEQRSS
jgi:hypothetical protein